MNNSHQNNLRHLSTQLLNGLVVLVLLLALIIVRGGPP